MSGCRIGKVRFKNGTELRVIPNVKDKRVREVFADLDRARGWVDQLYGKDLQGYVLVVWDGDKGYNAFFQDGEIGLNLLPTFVAEAVRRDVGQEDTKAVLKRWFNG